MTEETKMILDEIKGLRSEIAGVKAELKDEIAGVRTELKEEMNELRTSFEKRFGNIERHMDTTRFIMENEIRENIKLVAEGHLDLYRKMEEVTKTSNEREIMFMRLKYLESEVRAIKDKYGIA